jgi:cytochrome P450
MFAATTSKAMAIKGPLSLVGAAGALGEMAVYLRGQVADCRRQARPGLIGDLVRQAEDGDALDENELLSMIFLLLIAGFETTTHLIETSVVALDQNPDQKAWLLADPEARMERAVEELARFTSPVQSTKPRFVATDGDFLGQNLKRGELIVGLVAAANADPARFDHTEQLRLDRFPNPHLVFSSGVHFCLGMQLARVEVQSALGRLYARFPDLVVPPADRLEWIERFGLRGVKRLPTRLNAAQGRLAA